MQLRITLVASFSVVLPVRPMTGFLGLNVPLNTFLSKSFYTDTLLCLEMISLGTMGKIST